jgi:hypothetical protein
MLLPLACLIEIIRRSPNIDLNYFGNILGFNIFPPGSYFSASGLLGATA